MGRHAEKPGEHGKYVVHSADNSASASATRANLRSSLHPA
jgi:hypothetical protein